MDEVNTLPQGMENKLLRLLADPYEGMMYVKRRDVAPTVKVSGLNVLYIFASNKTPDELIAKGFNSAVVERIRQYYFRIPPLCERPEDIALALSIIFHRKGNDNSIQWKKIDIKAFRFLCMLPWPDNFRGLEGFVDGLATQRQMRGMQEDPEISFEEVIECAVRRNLIAGR
jgi:DNA-binding NtrC family response regulator